MGNLNLLQKVWLWSVKVLNRKKCCKFQCPEAKSLIYLEQYFSWIHNFVAMVPIYPWTNFFHYDHILPYTKRKLSISTIQKISILPPRKGLKIPGEGGWGGYQRQNNLKKRMEFNWNFQRGGGFLQKSPFRGGGKDILRNYTKVIIKPQPNGVIRA